LDFLKIIGQQINKTSEITQIGKASKIFIQISLYDLHNKND
tara:strand:- start:93 stop:215 length:123 start_codon:yes stop_codon:yes gene_type:complete